MFKTTRNKESSKLGEYYQVEISHSVQSYKKILRRVRLCAKRQEKQKSLHGKEKIKQTNIQ